MKFNLYFFSLLLLWSESHFHSIQSQFCNFTGELSSNNFNSNSTTVFSLNSFYHQQCTWILDSKVDRQLIIEVNGLWYIVNIVLIFDNIYLIEYFLFFIEFVFYFRFNQNKVDHVQLGIFRFMNIRQQKKHQIMLVHKFIYFALVISIKSLQCHGNRVQLLFGKINPSENLPTKRVDQIDKHQIDFSSQF